MQTTTKNKQTQGTNDLYNSILNNIFASYHVPTLADNINEASEGENNINSQYNNNFPLAASNVLFRSHSIGPGSGAFSRGQTEDAAFSIASSASLVSPPTSLVIALSTDTEEVRKHRPASNRYKEARALEAIMDPSNSTNPEFQSTAGYKAIKEL